MENAGRSTPVTVISAVDADEGEFGEFTLSLTGEFLNPSVSVEVRLGLLFLLMPFVCLMMYPRNVISFS